MIYNDNMNTNNHTHTTDRFFFTIDITNTRTNNTHTVEYTGNTWEDAITKAHNDFPPFDHITYAPHKHVHKGVA